MSKARLVIAAFAAILCSGAVAMSAVATPLWNFTTRGAYSFVSQPKLHPPKLIWKVKHGVTLAHGYFLIANTPNLGAGPMAGQSGPELIDRHGHPVWFVPVSRDVVAHNLALQTYNGKPALSYWEGVENSAGVVKSGKDIVIDQQYKTVATLKGKDGWIVDLHEMVIDGTKAWVIASKSERKDLRPEHGPRHGTFVDNAVQEYDLSTGKLLYTWDAEHHLKPADTYMKFIRNGVWDPYHMDSLQLTGSKTFLVSLRNTWAAYQIDMSTNKTDWTLGGKHSTFRFKGKAQFQWQHDVRLHPNNVVSVFDDHCCQFTRNGQRSLTPKMPTRGLVLKLNMGKKTASMTRQYIRGKHFYAEFLGDTDLLSNGGAVIGWGSQPFFSEYGRSGKLLLDAQFPANSDRTYRATLDHWTGTPSKPPVGAVKTKGGRATVYASWNGATGVFKWRVLAGNSATHLSAVATKGNTGFETKIALSKKYKKYEVAALDSKGKTMASSKVFPDAPNFGRY
jgi:Arylsulfotransferase (ASST)